MKKQMVLFGFHGPEDMNIVGYLKINGQIKTVVDNISEATRFKLDPTGKTYDWARFFNNDDELKPWRFHPIIVLN